MAVPGTHDPQAAVPRLDAPRAILDTPERYDTEMTVETLPLVDDERNRRVWHAKMLAFEADGYSAIMIGSSNFTVAGMGLDKRRNVEANLLTIVDRVAFAREVKALEAVWPATEEVDNPANAEWRGAVAEADEEERAGTRPMPPGFVDATYRAGSPRAVVVTFDPRICRTTGR